MIRLFKIAKDSATKARTQTINQLRAVLARAEPALPEALAGLGLVTLVRRCAELSDTGSAISAAPLLTCRTCSPPVSRGSTRKSVPTSST
jgi:hypothetical protein